MSAPTHIDSRGTLCPQPIIDLAAAMQRLGVGDELRIISDDAAFPFDFEAWCKGMRHELLSLRSDAGVHTGLVRKAHS